MDESPARDSRLAVAVTLAQVLTGRLRRRLTMADPADRGRAPSDLRSLHSFSVGFDGAVLRALTLRDGDAWLAARRANAGRMDAWWGEDGAVLGAHDFERHYADWRIMAARGTGFAFALAGPSGVVGEVDVFVRHGGSAVEFGLWARPDGLSPRVLLGLMGALVDELILGHGVRRIDAPVAVGNDQPVKLIRLGGFREEGVLEAWRPLGAGMVDMRLFGMTEPRWREVRHRPRSLAPWPISPPVARRLEDHP